MKIFDFRPELFAYRTKALDALSEAGFRWFSHFSSVDILHDLFGLEICGIFNEDDALTIEAVLKRVFPGWKYSNIWCKGGAGDPGWKVIVHRDSEA